jgi:hypothetical protein
VNDAENKKALELLAQGKCVMVAEFRGGKAETINYTDKKSGKRAHFNRLAHAFEVGAAGDQVRVTERQPDDADMSKVHIPHKKGQRMLIVVEAIEVEKGNKMVSASELVPL